jgi:mono/diheme cytochrome c family protein
MKHGARAYLSVAFFTALVVVISPFFATGSPRPSTQASSDMGAAIFRKSCSVCHSIRPGEAKVGPSLYGALREGSGHSEQAVRQAIADGKGTMPGFKEKLEPREIDDLLKYLRTL